MISLQRVAKLLEKSATCSALQYSRRMSTFTKAIPIPHPLSYDHHRNGKFTNPWPSSSERGFGAALQTFAVDFDHSRAKPTQFPQQEPNWELILSPPRDQLVVTWIGHASFLVQYGGLNMLTDPIFSERCSMFQWVGPKRYMPVPCGGLSALVQKLPKIDFVVLSHNHYDHLDRDTVSALRDSVWFAPQNVGPLLKSFGVAQVCELDWWQSSHLQLSSSPAPIVVSCLPCQHFSGRSLFDRNDTLWATWAVEFPGTKVWFAGDTGYRDVPRNFQGNDQEIQCCPAFKEIGDVMGPFDLALIPIGAYSPRSFMSAVHLNPEDAVAVHLDVKSRRSIGMHWGTFILTDEPTDEPPIRLRAEVTRLGLSDDSFTVMQHGETRVLP